MILDIRKNCLLNKASLLIFFWHHQLINKSSKLFLKWKINFNKIEKLSIQRIDYQFVSIYKDDNENFLEVNK